MVRPIYPYELRDPDFSWLITVFKENNPDYYAVEDACLPVVLIRLSNDVLIPPSELALVESLTEKEGV